MWHSEGFDVTPKHAWRWFLWSCSNQLWPAASILTTFFPPFFLTNFIELDVCWPSDYPLLWLALKKNPIAKCVIGFGCFWQAFFLLFLSWHVFPIWLFHKLTAHINQYLLLFEQLNQTVPTIFSTFSLMLTWTFLWVEESIFKFDYSLNTVCHLFHKNM